MNEAAAKVLATRVRAASWRKLEGQVKHNPRLATSTNVYFFHV